VLQCARYTPRSAEGSLRQSVYLPTFYIFCSFVLVLWHVVPNLPQMDVWNVNKFDSVLI
jgi:hypothetical protein